MTFRKGRAVIVTPLRPRRPHRFTVSMSNEELRLMKAVTCREHRAAYMGSAAFLFWFRIGKLCDAAARRAGL